MEPWVIILTVLGSVAASSGFWVWLQSQGDKKDFKAKMLLGLGHDKIVYLGLLYIERGWITQDEYENLHDYLYTPYKGLNGNGSAERIMIDVMKLPIRKSSYKNKEEKSNDAQ